MDADAQVHALIGSDAAVAPRHQALQGERTFDGGDGRRELRQQAIAHRLDDAAIVTGDQGLERGEMLAQPPAVPASSMPINRL